MKRNEHSVWDISYALERIAEQKLNARFDHTGTFFDRDIIQKEMFYDDMCFLLHLYGGAGLIEFENRYYCIKRINMEDIENCQEIFDEFKQLLEGEISCV